MGSSTILNLKIRSIMEKKIIKQVVGIDIGSTELVVCLGRINEELVKELYAYRSFTNTAKGFIKLFQWVNNLTSQEIALHYVMEATGVYHESLAYYLKNQQCIVSIVLPNKISNYFKTLEVKTVTDKTSSEAITLFGLERKLEQWNIPAHNYKILKQLTRERDQLIQERTMIKNQMHSEKAEALPNSFSIIRMKERIDLLNKQESAILDEIKQIIKQDKELKEKVDLIVTIPGVGILTAAIVLAETNGFELIRNKKQLTSYAGLDIKEKQSGISIKGKPSISKRGNRYLRKALHLPALAAIRHEQQYKNTFIRIVSKHGIKMKAAIAIQRKILELMFILFKTGKAYDQNYANQKLKCEVLEMN
jgi:transposase